MGLRTVGAYQFLIFFLFLLLKILRFFEGKDRR